MRHVLLFICSFALLLTGCDGNDISDDTPATVQPAFDGGMVTMDAASSDGGAIDPPDGSPTSEGAAAFCARFDELCGYGDRQSYYVDEEDCISRYEGYDEDRMTCVEDALDSVENGGGFRSCIAASGARGCA